MNRSPPDATADNPSLFSVGRSSPPCLASTCREAVVNVSPNQARDTHLYLYGGHFGLQCRNLSLEAKFHACHGLKHLLHAEISQYTCGRPIAPAVARIVASQANSHPRAYDPSQVTNVRAYVHAVAGCHAATGNRIKRGRRVSWKLRLDGVLPPPGQRMAEVEDVIYPSFYGEVCQRRILVKHFRDIRTHFCSRRDLRPRLLKRHEGIANHPAAPSHAQPPLHHRKCAGYVVEVRAKESEDIAVRHGSRSERRLTPPA
mmetsp:Transcript_25209/g.63128  ORF Transcript_25209/g.63128 Transcript_25209/m.63128 type:complete len:258 (-) Transcript_25209:1695-2468(-)